MPSQSAKIVTADFLFTEFKIGGICVSDFGWRAPTYEDAYEAKIRAVMTQVGRVLVPKGRFIVVEYADNVPITVQGLEASGFKCTVRPVSQQEMGRTLFLKEIPKIMEMLPENKERAKPMRIIAIKKE